MSQLLPLVEQLRNLERVQELDLKIDSLKKDQTSLPAGLKSINESLDKLQASLDVKKKSLAEIEKVRRQTQAALDLNRERLVRSNTKLEEVHNSQEFQAATKEIEQLKKLNVTLEEQDKKASSDCDAIQKELNSLSEQIEKIQQEKDTQSAVVSGQESQFKKSIDSLLSERSEFSSKVEARILSQYDRIRSARGGIGIVPAIGGRCKGCNMMVPPQLYNEIHRGTSLHSCPSCHRLLHVSAGAPATAEKAVG